MKTGPVAVVFDGVKNWPSWCFHPFSLQKSMNCLLNQSQDQLVYAQICMFNGAVILQLKTKYSWIQMVLDGIVFSPYYYGTLFLIKFYYYETPH